MFRMVRSILALSFVILWIGRSANADIVNGSFENGLTGWQHTNSPISITSLVDYSIYGIGAVHPTSGVADVELNSGGIGDSAQFVLPGFGFTANDFVPAYPYAGSVPNGWMPGGQIAMLYQTFSVNAGDKISFDWNFVGLDFFSVGGGADWSWWAIRVDNNPFYVSMLGNQLNYPNGIGQMWHATEYEIQTSGSATIFFASSGDTAYPSNLYVDNVRLSISAVPEPTSMFLLATLLPLAVLRRSRKSTSSATVLSPAALGR